MEGKDTVATYDRGGVSRDSAGCFWMHWYVFVAVMFSYFGDGGCRWRRSGGCCSGEVMQWWLGMRLRYYQYDIYAHAIWDIVS